MFDTLKQALLKRLALALAKHLVPEMTDLMRQRAQKALTLETRRQGRDHTMLTEEDRAARRAVNQVFPHDFMLERQKPMAAANPARAETPAPRR